MDRCLKGLFAGGTLSMANPLLTVHCQTRVAAKSNGLVSSAAGNQQMILADVLICFAFNVVMPRGGPLGVSCRIFKGS